MSELTYEDFKQRINIQEVLQDAGYRLNRKDGIPLSLLRALGQQWPPHSW